MDEARQVLRRLERIAALQEARSERTALLGELRALLREGQAWLERERGATERAEAALSTLEERLTRLGGGAEQSRDGREVMSGERTSL
jgi:isoaspartyl peptidase/L-asparaginase-like protein (Ntn-hydrolase superfamily)